MKAQDDCGRTQGDGFRDTVEESTVREIHRESSVDNHLRNGTSPEIMVENCLLNDDADLENVINSVSVVKTQFFGDVEGNSVWQATENLGENVTSVGVNEECPTWIKDSEDERDSNNAIVINRIQGITVRVPLKICGVSVQAVIDTGAEVSILSEKVFQTIPRDRQPTLEKAPIGLVVADKAVKLPDSGVANVDVQFKNRQFDWQVYVAPIADDFLMGSDMLDEQDVIIHIQKGVLVDGEWVNSSQDEVSSTVRQLSIDTEVVIPANHEVVFPVNVPPSATPPSQRYAFFEPTNKDERSLVIARSLVDTSYRTIPVRCMNLSEDLIRLKRGYLLGNLFNLTSEDVLTKEFPEEQNAHIRNIAEVEVNRNSDATGADSSTVPEHLREMYEEACTNVESPEIKKRLIEILIQYQDAFAKSKMDVGSFTGISHRIDTGCAAPIRQPLRRTPRGFEAEEEKNLKEQLQAGVIRASSSPWASAVVLVRKSDGTVRWCIDYRQLNDCTKKDAYPLPRIDMCLDSLGGVQYFSTLDLQSGYWQIPMEESDIPKTAFITKYGLYEYLKMPFGLCNAPSTFQRSMEMIFRGLQWKSLLIYLDDVIVLGRTQEENLDRLEDALDRILRAGLKLKPVKCKLMKTEVLYLGHIISKDGLKPNPKLVEAVLDFPVPRNQREVMQFHGLVNYYRKFIKNFSDIAFPLTQLIRKDVPFEWSRQAELSFECLKIALCRAPILSYPSPVGEYILDTDASDTAVGAVLSQMQDGEERPLAFGSKKLNKQQQRYCVTRKELLAVVVFLAEFRHWLLGPKFKIRTDHSSLRWLMNFKEPQGQLARWLEYIQQYNFEVIHRPGRKHQNADALSRADPDPTECKEYAARVKLEQLPCGGCTTCQRRQREWATFESEVDDVVPLTVGSAEVNCRQVTTRHHKAKRKTCSLSCCVACPSVNKGGDSSLHTTMKNVRVPTVETRPDVSPTTDDMPDIMVNEGNPENISEEIVRVEVPDSDEVDMDPGTSPLENDPVDEPLTSTVSCAVETSGSAKLPTPASWIDGYDSQSLAKLQREDSDIKPLHDWLDQGTRPNREEAASLSPATRLYWLSFALLTRLEGVLYYKWIDPDDTRPCVLKLIVPRELHEEVLKQCHDSIFGAHLGVHKTVSKLKQRYHWYRMSEDVKVHIRCCHVCSRNRQPYRRYKAAMANFRVGYPLDRIGIDIMGPLPLTERGNRYIFVIADYFTRWVEGYPLPDQTAETVARTLVHEFVCRFGAPLELHSDQGRNFESSLFSEVCKLMEIRKTRSTPYHPESNGLVERFNRTLASMIRCQVEDNIDDWDLQIPLLTAAYRSCIHPATGFTPNFLMFGREINLPVDLLIPRPREDLIQDVSGYVNTLRERLHDSYNLARQALRTSSERQKKQHDTRVQQNKFLPGDLVYKRNHRQKKFDTPWVGPLVIKTAVGDCLYKVVDKRNSYILHHDLLKPYTSTCVPAWVQRV